MAKPKSLSLGTQRGSAVSDRNEKRDIEEDEWDYGADDRWDFSLLDKAFKPRPKKRTVVQDSSAGKFNIRIRQDDISLLDALSKDQGISRAALLNRILHDIMCDALMSWEDDDARVFLAENADDEMTSRTSADLGAQKRRAGDGSGARAKPCQPTLTPEIISDLQNLVKKTEKTVAQAAEDLGISISTYDELARPWVNDALSKEVKEMSANVLKYSRKHGKPPGDDFDTSNEEKYRSKDFIKLRKKLGETDKLPKTAGRSRKGNLPTRQSGDHQK